MKSRIIPFLSLFLFLVSFVAPVTAARGNSADVRIRLAPTADIRGKATAKYRNRGGEREFQVEVEVARRLAGAVFLVAVDGEAVGEVTINAFGKGRLSLNNQRGDLVPEVVRGSVVEIVSESGIVVFAGRF